MLSEEIEDAKIRLVTKETMDHSSVDITWVGTTLYLLYPHIGTMKKLVLSQEGELSRDDGFNPAFEIEMKLDISCK